MKRVFYGKYVDLMLKKIRPVEIQVVDGVIKSIIDDKRGLEGCFIMPGFIDSHVHVESSMLVPVRFAELAVLHGTVAAVCDPHEIANVLGEEGILFMLENSRNAIMSFYFGVPSCVPATKFESSGAILDADRVGELLKSDDFYFLSEMMNFPGVIYNDSEVLAKLNIAKQLGKPIDGHAPALSGDELKKYVDSGISTDHECFTLEEAIEKIGLGMKVLVREGSAAKNFETLSSLIPKYADDLMFCTDDCHPDDLMEKHISDLVRRSLRKGYDLFDVLQIACVNPVKHYGLDIGLLRVGDRADFICVEDLEQFRVLETYIKGKCVYDGNKVVKLTTDFKRINKFTPPEISKNVISVESSKGKIKVIKAIDGELITKTRMIEPKNDNGFIVSDLSRDVLKIVVISRYNPNTKPVVGFISGFGLANGAIAGSIAHDSHNIIAVGVDDESILKVVAEIYKYQGGIAYANNELSNVLPLPIAGLMSDGEGSVVAQKYKELNQLVKNYGCKLNAPFMTLSFMALLVIPELKIGDKGLFDGTKFAITSLFE